MLVHVYAPVPQDRACKRTECPCCKKRSVILHWFYEWHGWSSVCLRCGDRWEDGQRLPRPFEPQWRKKSADSARAMWRMGRRNAR